MGCFPLERGRGGVRLTSDGLKLLPQLQRICNEHEILMLLLDDLHSMQSGLIRIGRAAPSLRRNSMVGCC